MWSWPNRSQRSERASSFIEENHAYKMAQRQKEDEPDGYKRRIPLKVMQFWGRLLVTSVSQHHRSVTTDRAQNTGYKFETLSTLPAPWGECSRELIENRENEIVNNKSQYCSIVRTGLGKTNLCLGGEVDAGKFLYQLTHWHSQFPSIFPRKLNSLDAVWDSKPAEKGRPINWVELKTSAEIRGAKDMENFHRKLMKYWIQSFLLGVPKIIVGFRTRDGILADVKEIETQSIPQTVNSGPNPAWNANICTNFAAEFLECKCSECRGREMMIASE